MTFKREISIVLLGTVRVWGYGITTPDVIQESGNILALAADLDKCEAIIGFEQRLKFRLLSIKTSECWPITQHF